MSPTQRTLARCREQGMTAQVVERWNPHARIRQDLFGCIDLLAIPVSDGAGLLGIQACAGSSHAARLAKAMAEPRLREWLRVARFQVWSWAKRGARGKRKLWTLRVSEVGRCRDGALTEWSVDL